MKFGPVPLAEAEGALLAHGVAHPQGRLPKGTILTSTCVQLLRDNGIEEVVVAKLEPGDMTEDEAAGALASAIRAENIDASAPATGRVNFYASANGLFTVDKAQVDAFNTVDPAITLACLKDAAPVKAGDMVATIKIIPLAVDGAKVELAAALAAGESFMHVKAYRQYSVALIQTQLPVLKGSVLDKTAQLLQRRLAASGSVIVSERRVAHDEKAVAQAILDALADMDGSGPKMIVLFGASAVCDAEDVLPSAMRMAGGVVDQVGLPVDPGNLLVLGHKGDVPLIAAPGCARSPKENGFDWVLDRLLCGLTLSRNELTGWGVGGLLMEIPSRPQPREISPWKGEELSVGMMLMAAGQARRMGGAGHKLLAEFDGVPLVRRMAQRALATQAGPLVAVTGFRAADVEAALADLPIECVRNEAFASGMASSIKSGLLAEAFKNVAGVMVLLADMPAVSEDDLAALVAAFRRLQGRAIIRASAGGKRGNPVILPRVTFSEIALLEGDVGARQVIETCGLPVVDIEIGEAAHLDVDTAEAVERAGGVLRG
ncbi:NTP transferase domain-containing protein [Rhizobium helianthi]|uniref:NTP transferase domain-containing protein n=1 Tax=Rhizobium helianthi TaxID=1132695 RepID=A0ABW4LYI6_9HYPH